MIVTQKTINQARSRHQAVYDAIRQFKITNNGKPPTVRELCDLTGITSTSLVIHYLENLELQGVLHLGKTKSSRHIKLVGETYSPPEPVEIK